MARKLLPLEFHDLMANRLGIPQSKFQNIYENLIDFIISELRMYGEIRLPNFTTIKLEHVDGRYTHVPIDRTIENRGKTKEIWVEPYEKLRFIPTDRFKDNVNYKFLSRAEIRKQRAVVERDKRIKEEIKRQEAIKERALQQLQEIAQKKKEKELVRKGKLQLKTEKEIEEEEYGYNG